MAKKKRPKAKVHVREGIDDLRTFPIEDFLYDKKGVEGFVFALPFSEERKDEISEIYIDYVPYKLKTLSILDSTVEELSLPTALRCEEIDVFNANLHRLDVPTGISKVRFHNSGLKKLTVPTSIKEIRCNNNIDISNLDELLEKNPDVQIVMSDNDRDFFSGGERLSRLLSLV